METRQIEFVETDDWVELVIDGERIYGNYSISSKELLKILGIKYTETYIEDKEAWNEHWSSKRK